MWISKKVLYLNMINKQNLNTMKNLNEILTNYAKEDLQLLKDNGVLSITDTKKGCLDTFYENNIFTISWNMGQNTFQTPDEECAIDFIKDSYIVEC